VLVATCQNSHGQRAKQAALISGQGHGHGRGRKGNPDSVLAAPAFCINNIFFPPDSIPLAHDKLDVLSRVSGVAKLLLLQSPETPLPYPYASNAVHLFSDIATMQCPAADMH